MVNYFLISSRDERECGRAVDVYPKPVSNTPHLLESNIGVMSDVSAPTRSEFRSYVNKVKDGGIFHENDEECDYASEGKA